MQFDTQGNIVVADSYKGLVSIRPSGHVETLLETVNGKRMLFPDGLAISSAGTVWFTDASARWGDGAFGNPNYAYEFLENRPTGRVLSYDPETAETRVHLDSLRFANGLALAPDESYLLVSEALGYRVTRLWIDGRKTGSSEVFVNNLPCFPDNITFNGRDTFWIACFMPRDETLDAIRAWPSWLKKVAVSLPTWLQPRQPDPHGLVIGLDLDGNVTRTLHDPTGRYLATTSAIELDGWLYLGSVVMPGIGRVRL
jgi:sugar lactone lactonase YvrE